MKNAAAVTVAVLVAAAAFTIALPARAAPPPPTTTWTTIVDEPGLHVETRPRTASGINEMVATAVVDVPLAQLAAVVRDVDGQRELFPNVTVSRHVEGADKDVVLQRSEGLFLAPREYVIAIEETTTVVDEYTLAWRATDRYATGDDAIRVTFNEGSWKLEALSPSSTRVTFRAAFDPKGALPPWIVNLTHGGAARAVLVNLVRLGLERRIEPASTVAAVVVARR